jgi:soluble lytic murein transglycosylase-like protein
LITKLFLAIGSVMLMTPQVSLALKTASKQTKLPLDVLHAVAKQESQFNPKIVSPAGAMGLMQIMPVVATTFKVKDPFDPIQNALAGAKLLKSYFKQQNGHWPRTLASYNWGLGNVKKHPDPDSWPSETKNYVNKIMRDAKQYFALYL